MRALIETFFPLDLRRDGILNDARQNAALPDVPLQEISAPTLIVHGSADRTVPHAQAEAAARAIPNARLVSVPNGTHETTFVAPGALAAIAMHLSAGKDLPVRSILSVRSRWSALSAFSVLSVASAASVLSVGSFASILSIGSAASILSIGSTGSILCVGSAGGFLCVGGRHGRSQTGAQEAHGAPTVGALIPR